MDVLRTFLACELPSALQDAIQKATAGLRGALGKDLIRWVPSHNIHLTLKFLGDVSPSSLEPIKAVLAAEAVQCQAFEVRVGGLGCYPNPRRPRIVWTALNAPAELAGLQHNLEVATARLGYASEERGFSPHLTIGRVRQHTSAADLQKIRGALEQMRLGDIGVARLEAIHLFRSDLQATGSVYTRLFTAHLGMS
jgi:2'-5' RNA ligase